jgi:hypothetical protein
VAEVVERRRGREERRCGKMYGVYDGTDFLSLSPLADILLMCGVCLSIGLAGREVEKLWRSREAERRGDVERCML